jgi:uncharacterized membrane protein
MNRKKVILLTLILVAVVLTAAVAGAATETFHVRWNGGLGGGSGGGISNSASFRLVGSEMGAISVGSTSASYNMCVGFLCGGNVWSLLLPIIYR